jgi:hypothetical protein
MRKFWPVLLALSLCGCGADGSTGPSAGNWAIGQQIDRISGSRATRAQLSAFTVSGNRQHMGLAYISLLCFDGKPIVRLSYPFRVGANSSAIVEYRFDKNPGRKATVRFMPDFRTIVIDDRAEVAQVAEGLATSAVLYVRVSSLHVGRAEAEFRVPGGGVATEATYAECPLRRTSGTAGRNPAG